MVNQEEPDQQSVMNPMFTQSCKLSNATDSPFEFGKYYQSTQDVFDMENSKNLMKKSQNQNQDDEFNLEEYTLKMKKSNLVRQQTFNSQDDDDDSQNFKPLATRKKQMTQAEQEQAEITIK